MDTDTSKNYSYRPTAGFTKKLEKVKGRDPSGYDRINDVIERLLVTPGDADGKMVGIYNGRLKKYVGRKDYRLIYHWCEICRKENRKIENKCNNCDIIPDNTVIFFDLYHKSEAKKFKKLERG